MAHKLYTMRGAIADGTFTLVGALGAKMGDQFATGIVSVTLFDSDDYDTAVLASAGTLTVTASEDSFNFGSLTDGEIDLTVGTYTRPSFRSFVTDMNFVWAGVTGDPTHFEIRVWRNTD